MLGMELDNEGASTACTGADETAIAVPERANIARSYGAFRQLTGAKGEEKTGIKVGRCRERIGRCVDSETGKKDVVHLFLEV